MDDQPDPVAVERERAARLCERQAEMYEQRARKGRECCAAALRLAAPRIRLNDETAKVVADAAKRIRKREGWT